MCLSRDAPPHRDRSPATKLLTCCDFVLVQLQLAMKIEGLRYFAPKPGHMAWAHWSRWPHLSVVADQGSDGMCALSAAMCCDGLKLKVSPLWDPAHGAWRDTQCALRELKLFPWLLLLLITVNLPHGPDLTCMRFNQIKAAMAHCFSVHSSGTCLLFQTHARAIMEELGSDLPDMNGASKEESAWAWLREHSVFLRRGYKCNLNRFMSAVHEGSSLRKRWTASLFPVRVCRVGDGYAEEPLFK